MACAFLVLVSFWTRCLHLRPAGEFDGKVEVQNSRTRGYPNDFFQKEWKRAQEKEKIRHSTVSLSALQGEFQVVLRTLPPKHAFGNCRDHVTVMTVAVVSHRSCAFSSTLHHHLADMTSPPLFPLDLEREIFETTALIHPGTIPALLRVARRVLTWIEPLLYRVIRIGEEDSSMIRVLNAMDSRTPELFHNAVRHLALESNNFCSHEAGRRLLALCNGATNFASISDFTDPSLLPFLAEMQIQRLSLSLVKLFGPRSVDPSHPLFQSVTHLDIFGLEGVVDVLPATPLLPALTHLCLNSDIPLEPVLNVLVECPRLRLLLLQWAPEEWDSYVTARTPHEYDVRFVIGVYGDYWADWEAGARGFADQWTQGDDFVARKRNGEIEATRYWLE